jgi:hypothetical protein
MSESQRITHGSAALQKLEKFFQTLNEDEKAIISEMVRASLLQAAEHFAGAEVASVPGATEAFAIPGFVVGLTGANAPSLVASLHLPGSLAAHSIPGCNSSALMAVRVQSKGL